MTINRFEPSRRVLPLLKGLFRRQKSILFFSQKKNLTGIGPPYRFPVPCYRFNWNRPHLAFPYASRRLKSIYCHIIVIKWLFILWNKVPSALVLKPLNWIWFYFHTIIFHIIFLCIKFLSIYEVFICLAWVVQNFEGPVWGGFPNCGTWNNSYFITYPDFVFLLYLPILKVSCV